MTDKAFNRIAAGLDDAVSFAKGDTSRGVLHESPASTIARLTRERDAARTQEDRLESDVDATFKAIGDEFVLLPPDGGDSRTYEAAGRLRAAYDDARNRALEEAAAMAARVIAASPVTVAIVPRGSTPASAAAADARLLPRIAADVHGPLAPARFPGLAAPIFGADRRSACRLDHDGHGRARPAAVAMVDHGPCRPARRGDERQGRHARRGDGRIPDGVADG